MGISTKIIGKKDIAASCYACKEHALSAVTFQKVYNIFRIPTFPLSKNTSIVCGSCGSTFPCKLYPMEISNTDIIFKTPWLNFSGSAIFITLFFSFTMIEHSDSKALAESHEAFLVNPQPGAYFVFRFKEDGIFSIGNVEKVEGDKILLRYSRESEWHQGMAMQTAETCLKKNIKLPSMLKVTLEEFKHMEMEVCNIYLPEK